MEAPVCPFCNLSPERIIHRDDLVVAFWDGFPVSPGHALVATRRHVRAWFDASPDEQRAIVDALPAVRAAIEASHRPDAYNIGTNAGAAAGQTIDHLHVHVIPRYAGDVADPRGGVRGVIPGKARYG